MKYYIDIILLDNLTRLQSTRLSFRYGFYNELIFPPLAPLLIGFHLSGIFL
jgi:hypothetical protein